jgi:hypothetical protein
MHAFSGLKMALFGGNRHSVAADLVNSSYKHTNATLSNNRYRKEEDST